MGPLDGILANTIASGAWNIKSSAHVWGLLTNWPALIHQTANQPTHVKELIEHTPSYRELVDASKWGVGGVWFSRFENIEPIVWFEEWPQAIRNQLCASNNPKGTITISDPELTGIFMHFLVLEAQLKQYGANLRHKSIAIWCDNLPAIVWTYKF
jgi:hypothetical protein